MLIGALIIALLAGLFKGGKLRNLAEMALKSVWLVILAFAIQTGVYLTAVKGVGLGPAWLPPILHTGSYFLLLVFVLRNFHVPGVRILGLGILLNALVIGLNGGLMPVDSTYLPDESRNALLAGQGTHGLLTEDSVLGFLADRLFLSVPGLGRQLFSIGDVFIDIGTFILVYDTMTRARSHRIKTLSR